MGGRGDFPKEMYKLICIGTIDSCKWTKLNAELDRIYFVAIPIPNLANKLCNWFSECLNSDYYPIYTTRQL